MSEHRMPTKLSDGKLTRRQSLRWLALGVAITGCGGGGGSGTAAPPAPSPAPPPSPSPSPSPAAPSSIRQAAAAKGMRFGSVVGAGQPGTLAASFRDAAYRDILIRDCQMLVAENEMKWPALRPDATRFDFTRADELVAFAQANGLAMRGHTLLWHHPRWMAPWTETHDYGANPAAEAERLIRQHIGAVVARYRDRIHSWDAVNEAVDPATGALRETAFSRAMGGAEPVIDLAFRAAREAAPQAELVYNDYMGWEPGNASHRAGVLRLLEGFRARGVPVDALGIQSHIGIRSIDPATGTGPREEAAWRQFLDAVVAMGYRLVITEFDVNDKALPTDIAVRDRGVADYARAYLDLMFSYRQLEDVMAWGMVDSYSWLQGFDPRADGQPLRPTPYDAAFRPKLLHQAIVDAFAAAPAR